MYDTQRGYSRFQAMGRCKGFFGFEIHNLGIFLDKKILASIFSGSLYDDY